MSEQEALAVILGSMGIIAVFAIAWYVILVIACWRIFTKAGEAGWKSIIPFYNSYILYKLTWKGVMFWVVLVMIVAGYILNSMDNTVISILGWLMITASTVTGWVQKYKFSQSFGHGIGFAVGLVLLNPIFTLILGFGGDQYQGPK